MSGSNSDSTSNSTSNTTSGKRLAIGIDLGQRIVVSPSIARAV